MLTEALAFPKFFPEIDLGVSADQESMARIMSSDGGEPPGTNYKDGVIYFPRTWFNAYELSHGYEGQKGSLLVHFPGMGADRWPHMAKWLDAVKTQPHEWEVPLNQTTYASDTHDFWDMLRKAKELMEPLKYALSLHGSSTENVDGLSDMRKELDAMQEALWSYTDDISRFRLQLAKLQTYCSNRC
jgi:hypothetical protein